MAIPDRRAEYDSKLQDPRWLQLQEKVLIRDGYKCCICGHDNTTKRISAYHLIFDRREPWDYPLDTYRSMCGYCYALRKSLTTELFNKLRVVLFNVRTERIDLVCEQLVNKAKELV